MMISVTTLECISSDVYNHFDLELSDLSNLTTTNVFIRNLILNSNIRINSVTTYTKNMNSWVRFLLNIKVTNNNLRDIRLFANF